MTKVIKIRSADQLREHSSDWDRLWESSRLSTPAARADMLALWLDTLLNDDEVNILAVEQDDRFVAALPLLLSKKSGVIGCGSLPRSDWTGSGNLLLNPNVDPESALTPLVDEIQKLDWHMLWFDEVFVEDPSWQLFCRLLREARISTFSDARFEIGVVDVDNDWDAYCKKWSRMHRRNMKRYTRQLRQQGDLQLRVLSGLADDEVAPAIRRGFAVEDRNWKGRDGSSVLSNEAEFDYITRQSLQLNSWKQLELVFLELDEKPIAFEWGWTAKGVYHATKVGYDESYAKWAPGQVLRYLLFEKFSKDESRQAVDFAGVLSTATGKWCTRTYPAGRIVAGRPTLTGRALMTGYRAARKVRDRIRIGVTTVVGQSR